MDLLFIYIYVYLHIISIKKDLCENKSSKAEHRNIIYDFHAMN